MRGHSAFAWNGVQEFRFRAYRGFRDEGFGFKDSGFSKCRDAQFWGLAEIDAFPTFHTPHPKR